MIKSYSVHERDDSEDKSPEDECNSSDLRLLDDDWPESKKGHRTQGSSEAEARVLLVLVGHQAYSIATAVTRVRIPYGVQSGRSDRGPAPRF